jgi:hypothetical protein
MRIGDSLWADTGSLSPLMVMRHKLGRKSRRRASLKTPPIFFAGGLPVFYIRHQIPTPTAPATGEVE